MIRFVLWLCVFLSPSLHASQLNTILVVGDSLSAAYGFEKSQGWVELLQQKLKQEDRPYQVINASISGDTSIGGRNRLASLLSKHKPEIVIIELGGNDGLRGFPLKQIKKNLASMIQSSQAQKARVILTGIKIPPNYGQRYTDAFYQVYTELANEYDTLFVPFLLEGVATQSRYMQADGIHPNAQAQPLILQQVWPVLSSLW